MNKYPMHVALRQLLVVPAVLWIACTGQPGKEAEVASADLADVAATDLGLQDQRVGADQDIAVGDGGNDGLDAVDQVEIGDGGSDGLDAADQVEIGDGGSDGLDAADQEDTVPWECQSAEVCDWVEYGKTHSIVYMVELPENMPESDVPFVIQSLSGMKVVWTRQEGEPTVVLDYVIDGTPYYNTGVRLPRRWFEITGVPMEPQKLTWIGVLPCGIELELGSVEFNFQPGRFWDASWALTMWPMYAEWYAGGTHKFPVQELCDPAYQGDGFFVVQAFDKEYVSCDPSVLQIVSVPAVTVAQVETLVADWVPPELLAEPFHCAGNTRPEFLSCTVRLVNPEPGLGLWKQLIPHIDAHAGQWISPACGVPEFPCPCL